MDIKRPASYIAALLAALFLVMTVMGVAYDESESANLTIHVTVEDPNQPPIIYSLSCTVVSGPLPLEMAFAVVASDPDGIIVQHLWDFGDGSGVLNTGPISSISYTYTTEGNYTVTVTVMDDDGAEATRSEEIQACII